MSNRRAPGQRLINLAAQSEFVELLDEFIGESSKYRDRSQFIRDAIVKKVSDTLGKTIPPHLALPPGRAGKGGRQITSYKAEDSKAKKASSEKASVARAAATKAAQDQRNRGAK